MDKEGITSSSSSSASSKREGSSFESSPAKKAKEAVKDDAKRAMRTVLLGSKSSSRRRLLASVLPDGFEVFPEMMKPEIDEKAIRMPDPKELVVAIADAKMTKVLSMIDEKEESWTRPDFVLCADQVIVFDGTIREKPETKEMAKHHLQSYGLTSKPAECTCGLVVANAKTRERFSGVNIAVQHFKEIPDAVADALIEKGEIMHCAGSFVVEDELMAPYVGPRTGEIESVQGMPVALTQKLLQQAAGIINL